MGKDDAIIYAGPTCDARERRSGEYPWPCPASREEEERIEKSERV